jgi:flagella basal body P-ring formation protein FlgA
MTAPPRPRGASAALALALALASPLPAGADTLVAAAVVRAGEVLTFDHLAMSPADPEGALTGPEQAVGLEARVHLYPGRPIRPEDLALPVVVRRNAPVTLVYRRGTLRITAEGRALSSAAAGQPVRALNLSSRSTVSGTAMEDGSVVVD